MKKLLSIALLCISPSLFAQVIEYRDLQYNDIAFRHNTNGSFFENDKDGKPFFRVPAAGEASSIYAANLWIAATLDNGDTTTLVGTYVRSGQEVVPGPASSAYDNTYFKTYYTTYPMTVELIQAHRANFAQSGYQMPAEVANWPAHGRPDLESTNMAPFEDLNHNGVYEPMLGDYPAIPGDMALFYMKNSDFSGVSNTSGGLKMKLQINGFLYAFKSDYPPLNHTIFNKNIIQNISSDRYNDILIGQWADIDVGHSFDDYGGTLEEQNAVYCYNGSNTDEGTIVPGYGQNPPVQGFCWLNFPLTSSSIYRAGDPLEPFRNFAYYYNILSGKYYTGSEKPGPFDYPGDPNDPFGKTERTQGNAAGDRRAVATISVGSLDPGQTVCIDGAFVWSRENNNNTTNVWSFKNATKEVARFYAETLKGQCERYASGISKIEDHPLRIFPNPASSYITISNPESISKIEISDLQGRIVLHPQVSENLLLSDLSDGFYLIRLTLSNGSVQIQKIEKQSGSAPR